MKSALRSASFAVALVSVAVPLRAIDIVDAGANGPHQVNIGGTYTQNFDSLLASTPSSGVAWQNNVTLPGWYSSQSSYSANGINGGLASYGTGSDRALGSIGAAWSLRLINLSTSLIHAFKITYKGEQWYRGSNSPQQTDRMFFDFIKYSSGTSESFEIYNINGAGRVFVSEMYFYAPNTIDTSALFLDGNASGNNYEVSFYLTGVSLAPGEKIWFSWSTGDTVNLNDHAMGVDDLRISFSTAPIPEPAAAAALLGLVALAAATRRRSR